MALCGFDKYGIERLAPTMIANWDAAPATLVLRRVFGVRGQANANMWRGDAVEAGLSHWLRYRDLESAQGLADETFLSRCEGVLDEETEKARKDLFGMVEQGALYFAEHGFKELLATQMTVEARYQGLTPSIAGKMDFAFMEGCHVELKTTTRIPSRVETASLSHRWQAAFYADAKQEPVTLLYVSGKKSNGFVFEPGDSVLKGMLNTARAMERMFSAHDEGLDLLSSLPTSADSFYWDEDLINAYQSAIDGDLPPLKGTGTEALLRSGVITFGKHAGLHISDVPPKYLQWLLNPKLSDGGTYDVPEPLVEAIQEYLEAA